MRPTSQSPVLCSHILRNTGFRHFVPAESHNTPAIYHRLFELRTASIPNTHFPLALMINRWGSRCVSRNASLAISLKDLTILRRSLTVSCHLTIVIPFFDTIRSSPPKLFNRPCILNPDTHWNIVLKTQAPEGILQNAVCKTFLLESLALQIRCMIVENRKAIMLYRQSTLRTELYFAIKL